MSADNWAMCPACKKKNDDNNAKRIKDAESQYGEIPSGEYRALIKKAEKPIELEETLREDYEIGIYEDGSFQVSYRGKCETCGLQHTFLRTEVAGE